MRIFKYVLGGLFIAIVIGFFGWQIREKLILTIASYQLRNELVTLKRLAYKSNFAYTCQGRLSGYQLRFISETEYVIEPACEEQVSEPIQEGKLSLGVTRLYGSGVMIEVIDGVPLLKDGWVHLSYGESRVVVGIFDGTPKVVWEIEDLTIGGESPALGRCTDWGFSCCASQVEVGEFTKVRTYDCLNNCYQQCNRLPILMFFNTSPVLNRSNREVLIAKSDPVVRFGYEVSDDQEGVEVEVDFGDGKKSGPLPAKKDDLMHEYQCRNQQCVYTVKIEAKDVSGNELVNTELDSLRVVVR